MPVFEKSMNTNELRNEIERLFPFVPKPEGSSLPFHKDECFECEHVRMYLAEYEGSELPPKAIRWIYQEMSCLSADGWRWVLPSYLRYCLTQEASSSDIETEFLIYNLGPSERFKDETLNRLSMFNSDQIKCLIGFLLWCKNQEHWAIYCPEDIDRAIDFLGQIRI